MHVKFKKIKSEARIPVFAHDDDAGADLFSIEDRVIQPGEREVFGLGFASEFPADYVALVWDKGGPAANAGITVIAGVVDAGYRGEWLIVLLNTSDQAYDVKVGQKIAQVLFQKIERPVFVEAELSETARGEGRRGSTGLF